MKKILANMLAKIRPKGTDARDYPKRPYADYGRLIILEKFFADMNQIATKGYWAGNCASKVPSGMPAKPYFTWAYLQKKRNLKTRRRLE